MAAAAILDNFEWPYLHNSSIYLYSANRAVIFAIAQLSCFTARCSYEQRCASVCLCMTLTLCVSCSDIGLVLNFLRIITWKSPIPGDKEAPIRESSWNYRWNKVEIRSLQQHGFLVQIRRWWCTPRLASISESSPQPNKCLNYISVASRIKYAQSSQARLDVTRSRYT